MPARSTPLPPAAAALRDGAAALSTGGAASSASAAAPATASGWVGPACAVAGAVAFSGKAIIVKLAYRHGVDPVTLIMLRMLVALPFFIGMAAFGGRGKPRLTARDLAACAALGFSGYYLSSFLDFAGLQHVSASLERLILYLTPSLVMLASWALFGQRASGRQWLALCLSYFGLLLVFGHELSLDGPQVALGAGLVFASAACYAVYLVGSGRVVGRIGSLRLTGWASAVASVLCLAQFALLRPVAGLAAVAEPVLWLSLLNGTVCTVLPVWLVMSGIERIGPSRASQYGMVGPISTIVLGVLILGEPFTGWTAAGSACVLAGVALLSRLR